MINSVIAGLFLLHLELSYLLLMRQPLVRLEEIRGVVPGDEETRVCGQ